jgi:hypothetical protein
MGGPGLSITGDGSLVEKVNVNSNAGGGMVVAGTVVQSEAMLNGSFGIVALIVRDSTAIQNAGDGILVDAGGIASGNVSSSNGGYGIYVPFSTAVHNTTFQNKASGISALCPSAVTDNTVVSSDSKNIEISGSGCVLSNNAVRP